MAKSNKERQAALRKKRAALGQKEMRGIWVSDEEEIIVKKEIRALLRKMREEN